MLSRLPLLLALCVSAAAHAQAEFDDLRDISSARGYAMGGATLAHGLGTESILGNPAAIALFKMYRIELHGAWDTSDKDAFAGVSLMDAKTSPVAAGIDYHILSLRNGAGRATAHFTTLALALPLSSGLMIGSSLHYLRLKGGFDPLKANDTSVDAGLLVRLGGAYTLGFSAHNLLGTDTPMLSRYYSAHLGFFTGLFTLGADVRADFETEEKNIFTYSGGAEYLLGQSIPVRLGYSYDTFRRTSQLGVGLGFMTQEGGGIDFAYRHDFGKGDGRGRLLSLSIRMQVG
ncbi:hypothetical protein POL68_36375 [Stigmatella sp. ncwal1]|uniref:PorV/PorQ family protein n=1 Tax=Stigmatella ashevillensis TaxID=2995309 RepID=A0ABT5DK14_9BACT|nr:hypothetical protein [Stigmatella ashevillena]MDC0713999.1 hypothetical protein [Stigmatella ashevillena]